MNRKPLRKPQKTTVLGAEQVVAIRQAIFAAHELIPVEKALGRICAEPTASCPPAIPIAVSGEQITAEMIRLFRQYHVTQIDVLK